MAASMRPIAEDLQLPEELYDLILGHASRETLRTSRLVSRRFNEIAQCHLFHTVFLKVNVDSFSKLERISKQAHLSSKVRELIYDPALLPWDLNDFDEYMERGAGEGLQLDLGDNDGSLMSTVLRDQFLLHFSRLQLEYHFQQYSRYLAGQKYLHRHENEIESLTDIFRGLQRLTSLEILKWWEPEWARPAIPRRDWRKLPPILKSAGQVAQDTLIQPRGEQFRHRRFLAVMRAAEAAALPLQSLKVGPVVIEPLHTFWKGSSSNFIEQVLARLKYLQLDLVSWNEGSGTIMPLSELLFFSHQLQILELSGESRWRVSSTEYMPGSLSDIVWRHLRVLRFTFLSIDQREFMGFLANHSATLLELKLGDIDMKGSLVELLIFLSEQMELQSLVLEGIIGNRTNEEWQIWRQLSSDKEDQALGGKRPLLERILDYVLFAGPFPFTKRDEVSMEVDKSCEEIDDYLNPWIAEEDFSFKSCF